jgi:DNA-binding NtrC family response regulator
MSVNLFHIAVVEDDPWYSERLKHHLSLNPDFKITVIDSAGGCLKSLHTGFDLITIDYSLPDKNGLELVKLVRSDYPDLPIIAISSQSKVGVAVEFLKSGANDYIVKDDNVLTMLWNSIQKIREKLDLKEEVTQLRNELGKKNQKNSLIHGNSVAVQELNRIIERAAATNINVLINGETGTGKELVAKSIHFQSNRASKPFVAVNVAALPDDLIESELFGYEKGAFTGAMNRKKGRLEEAEGGTLFLDEIAEMNLQMQSKLLRALQEREIVRLGGNSPVKINVRLISASHKTLANEVKNGNFREDLFYRIIGLPIHLKPLRERSEDIPLLAAIFLQKFCAENNLSVPSISSDALNTLMKMSFPGNIRELKSIIELAAVLSDGVSIQPSQLILSGINTNQLSDDNFKGLTLKEINRRIIQSVLDEHQSNVQKAAEQLDIGKTRLYDMIAIGELILRSKLRA